MSRLQCLVSYPQNLNPGRIRQFGPYFTEQLEAGFLRRSLRTRGDRDCIAHTSTAPDSATPMEGILVNGVLMRCSYRFESLLADDTRCMGSTARSLSRRCGSRISAAINLVGNRSPLSVNGAYVVSSFYNSQLFTVEWPCSFPRFVLGLIRIHLLWIIRPIRLRRILVFIEFISGRFR